MFREQLALVIKGMPDALVKGAVEAGKTSALAKFSLTVLHELFQKCRAYSAEELKEAAEEELAETPRSLDADWSEIGGLFDRRFDELHDVVLALARHIKQHGALPDSFEEFQLRLFAETERTADRILGALPALLQRERAVNRQHDAEEFETEYLKAVGKQCGRLELIGIDHSDDYILPLSNAFVSLAVAWGDDSFPAPAEAVFYFSPRLVLRAPAGAGKTTLLNWLAFQCARESALDAEGRENPWFGFVPFVIPLRSIKGTTHVLPPMAEWPRHTIDERTWGRVDQMPPGWVDNVIAEKRALLLIDGLDEIAGERRGALWKEVRKLASDHPSLRIVVATRPFPVDESNAGQWNPPPDARVADVSRLRPSQIDELIQRWHDAAAGQPHVHESVRRKLSAYAVRLKQRLREPRHQKLRELAETPFLCAAICLVNKTKQEQLPERRIELYEECCKALLVKRDRARDVAPDPVFDKLSERVLFTIHSHLAWQMTTNSLPAASAAPPRASGPTRTRKSDSSERRGRDDVERASAENAYLIETDRATARKWVENAVKLTSDAQALANADSGLLLDHLLTRRALLREPARYRIDFHHRALQEYMAACAVPWSGNVDLLVKHAHDSRWRETAILAAGGYFAGKTDADQLIEKLLNRADAENLPVCRSIAAACLTTAKGVEPVLRERAINELKRMIPPRSLEEADVLAIVGEGLIEDLRYQRLKAKDRRRATTVASCARTLARIGGDKARAELVGGYGTDKRESVLFEVCQLAEVNPVELPTVQAQLQSIWGLKWDWLVERIMDLGPLSGLSGLKWLNFGECTGLSDLSPLSGLSELQTLYLDGCTGLSDLSPLSGLSELQTLYLNGCTGLSDLSPLAGLSGLQRLDLGGCTGLSDLSPLAGLSGLQWLDLSGCTGLSDLSPLAGLSGLLRLALNGCTGVGGEQIEGLKRALPKSDIHM